MKEILILKKGEKVHYIPSDKCKPSEIQNGIVKEIPEHTSLEVRVVYNCNDDWNNYENYTSALTPLNKLKKGWKENAEELINQIS